MRWFRRILKWGLLLGVLAALMGAAAIGVAYWLIAPRLPDVSELREVRLQVPLRVYSADGKLVAVFGETRRTPVPIAAIPEQVRQAFIAIEDARFYEHPGIDVVGIARAVWLLATSDLERVPGGSTITQQVAKNFFLSPEYSYTRKLTEIFLALKMERELSKDEILELYLNKIFFGSRAYGVVAAADFYYGKSLDELTLPEAAMLASIPKFPSTANPIANPPRARERRDYVLLRMLEEGFIDQATHDAAVATPDTATPHEPPIEVEAPWLAEMVRLFAIEKLGNEALTSGYVVHTTLDGRLQEAANRAVRETLADYDRRHGWRGAEARIEAGVDAGPAQWDDLLANFRPLAGLVPGMVTEVREDAAVVYLVDRRTVELPLAAMAWARPYLSENSRGPAPRRPADVVAVGDVVRARLGDDGTWALAQLPKAQGALVAMSPEDGAITALVGGFSFGVSKFNRAVQSNRNPGSSFKPFVYSAAFERGFTPASIVNDAPVVFPDPSRPDGLWKPSNDDDEFEGPMRLREAMVRSRNLVSVRLLDAIGVRFAREHIMRFGFAPETLPENLSLALGTSSVPPLAMARGYAAFANGGYLVDPWFVARIEDDRGNVVFTADPARACARCPERLAEAGGATGTAQDLGALLGTVATPAPAEPTPTADAAATGAARLAPRAIDPRNAYLVTSLLRDVVRRGTGRGAMEIGRNDLAGKTGTTNEFRDVWFSGYNDRLVATVWVGQDDFTPLGRGEFAARTAVPMWTAFMKVALDGVPETPLEVPSGITTARIDPSTGLPLGALSGDAGVLEVFKVEDIARLAAQRDTPEAGRVDDRQAVDIF
ncbi:MAG: penicillin-binding protein 1A [Xanthomonadaceae bacterium]|jgi:penicillin-binding protein 1A|nr:penicillin-binding protein 1A [Xanthomonadaceae bacterium]